MTSSTQVLYLEVCNSISLPELYLEDLQAAHKGSQSSQTLFAAATHSHQKSIASWCFKDTVDATTAQTRMSFYTYYLEY